jgi:hypothetical protein
MSCQCPECKTSGPRVRALAAAGFADPERLELTLRERIAVVRAMRALAQKYPATFGVIGGQGRRQLFIYEASSAYARPWLELGFRKGKFIVWSKAKPLLIAAS